MIILRNTYELKYDYSENWLTINIVNCNNWDQINISQYFVRFYFGRLNGEEHLVLPTRSSLSIQLTITLPHDNNSARTTIARHWPSAVNVIIKSRGEIPQLYSWVKFQIFQSLIKHRFQIINKMWIDSNIIAT